MLEQVTALQRSGTVNLDRRIDDELGGLRREQLGHRGTSRVPAGSLVVRGGGPVDQQPRRLDPGRHLRERVRDRLQVFQPAAECLPVTSMLDRRVESRLGHTDGKGTHTRPKQVERPHRHREARAELAEELV